MSNVFIKNRNNYLLLKKMRQERIRKNKSTDNKMIKACPVCEKEYSKEILKSNKYVCPDCNYHYSIPAKERIRQLVDKDTFVSMNNSLTSANPIDFPDYESKLEQAMLKSGLNEAVVTGNGMIDGIETQLIIMDSRFMMASMGSVVGEKIVQAIENAIDEDRPVVAVCASGGARMQEGMLSLIQMARTSAAVEKLGQSGNLFVCVQTHPTMGGVSASFASLGDIIIAEPAARIGFAGPRVIEQTIKEKLPKGFQSAEFMKEHGFVDIVCERNKLKEQIADILRLHNVKKSNKALRQGGNGDWTHFNNDKRTSYESFVAVDALTKARDVKRAKIDDFIENLFEAFIPFCGDRVSGEDSAIIGGIALFHGIPVTVIGHRKGKNLEENAQYNFGMARPQGYRKAIRLMEQAQKFKRPVFTFVDTPGAYPGLDAERDGQSMAIAKSMAVMSSLTVPIISVITGEGNSGGAIGIAVANSVLMMENAVYSILSPEGFASILWKDSTLWKDACEKMKMTSYDLHKLGIVDEVIKENSQGINPEDKEGFRILDEALLRHLKKYIDMSGSKVAKHRYEKFRYMGGKQ